jgi:hypothetical protein
MLHSHSILRLATFVGLAVFPSFASAGPITWSYRTQITYEQNYGSNFGVVLYPDGTVTALPGEYSGANLFYSGGNPMPQAGSYAANYRFQATVTITDVASGHSIDQVWSGAYTSQWSYPPEYANQPELWYWEFERSRFGDEMDKRNFMLGSNRYTVWADGGGQGQFPNGQLVVSVVHDTPEPATLTLVGLGIATLVWGRKRIRLA